MYGHCVDCGLPTDEFSLQDVAPRCTPCTKKKRNGEPPREYTEDEVRRKVINHIWAMIDYWFDEERRPGTREKMEGLAFSILSMLDGSSAGLPGFIVAPVGHKDDEEYHRERFENWFPHNGNKEQKAVKCDIGGSLHEHFHQHRPKDWPKDDSPREDLPQPIHLPQLSTPLDTLTMVEMYHVLDHLKKTVFEFSLKAWASLQVYLAQSKEKYHSGMFGDVKVMVISSMGQVMVTFWKDGKNLSIAGNAKSFNAPDLSCGLQGISGSAEDAQALVKTVLDHWDTHHLKVDNELEEAWAKEGKR